MLVICDCLQLNVFGTFGAVPDVLLGECNALPVLLQTCPTKLIATSVAAIATLLVVFNSVLNDFLCLTGLTLLGF